MSNERTEDKYLSLFREHQISVAKLGSELMKDVIKMNSTTEGSVDDFHSAGVTYMQSVHEVYPPIDYDENEPMLDPACKFIAYALEEALLNNEYLNNKPLYASQDEAPIQNDDEGDISWLDH